MLKYLYKVIPLLVILSRMSFAYFPNSGQEISNNVPEPGVKDWLVLQVEFAGDSEEFTTGTGKFLTTWFEVDETDTLYSVDPVPHDQAYFETRLKAVHHYWDTVTEGVYGTNTSPEQVLSPVEVPNTIRYYHPATEPDSIDFRLALFVYDAVKAYDDLGLFPGNREELIIYHAGVGQDFDFSDIYDPTPFAIP